MVGTSEGFVGCIYKLKVGRRPIEFDEKDPLINSFHKVSQCPLISSTPRLTTTPLYVPIDEDEEETSEIRRKPHSRQKVSSNRKNTPEKLDETNLIAQHSSNNPEQIPANRNSCSKNPCQNNGICWNDRGHISGYKCVCHPEFSGKSSLLLL